MIAVGAPGRALAVVSLLIVQGCRSVEVGGPDESVVFVCRNGVAMSAWSAAYFNQLAEDRGIRPRAIARAAIPSFREVPWRMTFALALDGYRLAGFRPRVIDRADVSADAVVVAIDTDLPDDAVIQGAKQEVWNGFPPMRERYFPSRAALKTRVEQLVDRLTEARDAD
jgi:hypothetical protein